MGKIKDKFLCTYMHVLKHYCGNENDTYNGDICYIWVIIVVCGGPITVTQF